MCRAAQGADTAERPTDSAAAKQGKKSSAKQKTPRQTALAKIDPATAAPGAQLQGKVQHVASYGAFVDVGLAKDQLLHVSEMTDEFVPDARSIMAVGDSVQPYVVELKEEGVVRLSLRPLGSERKPKRSSPPLPTRPKIDASQLTKDTWLEGTVAHVRDFGAFVDIGASRHGLLHRKGLSTEWVEDAREQLKPGDNVRVRIVEVGPDNASNQPRIALAITPIGSPEPKAPAGRPSKFSSGEAQAKLQTADLKRGQQVSGTVASVTDFGVFVDLGTPRHALLHQNQLGDESGARPQVGETVTGWVRSATPEDDKISLTQKQGVVSQMTQEAEGSAGAAAAPDAVPRGQVRREGRRDRAPAQPLDVQVGQELELPIESVRPYGVMLQVKEGLTALLHKNEMSGDAADRDIATSFTVGQQLKVTVVSKDDARRRVDVSQKTKEDRELDKQLESGSLSSKPAAKKGSAAGPGGSLASALALAGIAVKPAPTAATPPAPVSDAPQPAAAPSPAEEAAAPVTPPIVTDEVKPEVDSAAAEVAMDEQPSAVSPPSEPELAAARPTDPAVIEAPKAEPIDAAPIVEAVDDNLEPDATGPTDPAVIEAPKAEPIDPEPIVEAVHDNLEPDAISEPLSTLTPESATEAAPMPGETVDAGDVAVPSASAVLPGSMDPPAQPSHPADPDAARELLGKPADSPLVLDTDAGSRVQDTAASSSLGAVDLPPAEAAAKPANVAKLSDNGAVSEAREEPVAKPSPALDLAGDAVPSVASPPSSQPPDTLEQAGASPLAADSTGLSMPAQPAPAAQPAASSPSPTAVAEEEAAAPTAMLGEPPMPPPAAEKNSVPSSSSNGVPSPSSSPVKVSASLVQELRRSSGAGMMDCKKALAETAGNMAQASDYLRAKGLAKAGSKAGRPAAEGVIASYIHAGNRLGVILEVNCETDFVARNDKFRELVEDLAMEAAAMSDTKYVKYEDVPQSVIDHEKEVELGKEDILSKPEKFRDQIVTGRVEKTIRNMCLLDQPYIKELSKTVDSVIKESIAQLGENISIRRFERYTLGEGIQKRAVEDLGAEVAKQTQALMEKAEAAKKAPQEDLPEPDAATMSNVKVDAQAVKSLREESGAGMMDCKKALVACENNAKAAADWLRKKGLASAGKKAGRLTSEGALWSYIHTGDRLGVMVEVNCETDFVARSEKFLELCEDLSMQLAACDSTVVSVEDIPPEELERERQAELQKEDLASKPEKFRAQIVEGRVNKIAQERALLEAAFVRDTNKTVRQHIQEVVAQVGENIQVRRFMRYNLGEGVQKPVADLAADVAAQTQPAAV